MIVLDTHAWLWWQAEPRRLSRRAATTIERAESIGIASASVFELAELAEKRRIVLTIPTRAWVREALAQSRVEPLPLTAEVAVEAAQLAFARDPFDRIIYATARLAGATLVTRDERIRSYDAKLTVW